MGKPPFSVTLVNAHPLAKSTPWTSRGRILRPLPPAIPDPTRPSGRGLRRLPGLHHLVRVTADEFLQVVE
jgi:hypothetical protein